MFDAKSLLEQLAGSAPRQQPQNPQGGGLEDLLGGLLGGGQTSGSDPAQQGGGLGDLLRNIAGGSSVPNTGGGAVGGGLGDLLGQIKQQTGQAGGGGAGGNILDMLGQVLGQATEGVKQGAGRIGDATGARDALTNAAGGRTPEDMIAQIKELIANNQLGAGAVLGGLGGLLLGTKTGRGIAESAVKVGALALISGLAYKAYQNHQAGKPLISGAQLVASAAPLGSGFEPDAISNETAALMIRAMIAAASADGRIDDAEFSRIGGVLGNAADAEARAFLEQEMHAPSSAAALAAAVRTQEEAIEVYTAARLAIDPDSPAESGFLADLARALNIDRQLAAHIDASARGAAA